MARQQPWQLAHCSVAPRVQALLAQCHVRKRLRATSSSATARFEASLAAPHLAYVWQYSVAGRSHLAGAALLALAAATAPALLGGADLPGQLSVALLSGAALVAPQLLQNAVRAAAAQVVLNLRSGAVEVEAVDQKLLAAHLGSMRGAAPHTASLDPANSAALACQRRAVAGSLPAAGKAAEPGEQAVFAEVAALSAAAGSGYTVHPVLLDSCLTQAASMAEPAATAPLTWVRSVSALAFDVAATTAPLLGGAVCAAYQAQQPSWMAGSASLAAGGAALRVVGAVLGDHDLPPASPAPYGAGGSVPTPRVAPEEEEPAEGAVAADKPLLAMSEEERVLHLQAQVRQRPRCRRRQAGGYSFLQGARTRPRACCHLQVMTEVRAMLGRAVHPDEQLMAVGLDSRGGMELRRSLGDALGMQAGSLLASSNACT